MEKNWMDFHPSTPKQLWQSSHCWFPRSRYTPFERYALCG